MADRRTGGLSAGGLADWDNLGQTLGRVPKMLPGQSVMSGKTGYSVRSGLCDLADLSDNTECSEESDESWHSVHSDLSDGSVASVATDASDLSHGDGGRGVSAGRGLAALPRPAGQAGLGWPNT